MALFKDPQKRKVEIGSPELNPELIKSLNLTPITPDDLKLETPIDFQTPQKSSIFSVAGLNAQGQEKLLPEEQEQSDIVKRTQSLIDQFAGKATFQAEKETESGIRS